jgi:hypothetical protein
LQRRSCGCGPVAWQDDLLGVDAPTSFNKGSDGHFAPPYVFQFGLASLSQERQLCI